MADIKAAIKRGAFASRRRRSEQQEDVQEPPPPYTPIDRNGSGPSDSHEQPPRVSLRPESSRHAESSRPVESSSQDVRPRVSIPPPAVSPASPPYSPHTQHPFRFSPAGRGHITDLPLGILHRILEYTLHPRITPFAYQSDDGDTAMRAWLLFKLRGVDRRFFLAATSILRDRYLHIYNKHIPRGTTSDPLSHAGNASNPTAVSVFAHRSRETAIFDRFIALRIGEDLRKAESELCEDLGEVGNIFTTLQPAARTEDLLLTLPLDLITPIAPPRGQLFLALPLPQPHLVVTMSPLWTQLYILFSPVNEPPPPGKHVRRILVVEVRRGRNPDETIRRIQDALGEIKRGNLEWGDKMELW